MEEDQKNGLYDNHIGDRNKMVTAVESFAKELFDEGFYIPKGIYDRAKQMEKEQIMKAYHDDNFPCSHYGAEQYYNETYNK